ncbi:heme biosynthesis protein HemY [Methylobacterium gnaphalii]|uniref:Membrane protein n=1 Tax=Methylobacterium gnaphalii TaxID=1010610 RepID=A0A512JLN7_9HYPH|nr:heme biosynthesis HemY N-terminal domain-containing protein [Methylobacterium gnaphalii]GEP10861.1 membrane protein [Methylobacterium gnaphalii]GJD70761.1 Lipopolysaccharide assembly protein B [Methylobacterium gnaphalii]GLS50693.1 membrane protein [Methylobacterium gnaphalii]
MWRALVFLALLAIAAVGAVWVADHPGTVTIVWSGYEVGVSLAVALVGVLVAVLVVGIILAVVRGVIGLPGFLSRSTRERRRAKGMSALSRGMIAVGSGDPLAARRHAGDAERLLGAQPLTLLLKAQAAQISGDRDAAEKAFRSMADDPETRVLGLRGLYVEARRREDDSAARAYAIEAARLAPSVTWANDAVLEAQCADGDWSGATQTVERRASLGLMDKSAARRQRAVLLTASAQQHEAGEPEAALAEAQKAVSLAPDLVPAACIAGRLLARKGDLRKAAKVLQTAWKAEPHPDLAKVYLGLRPGDSTQDRLNRAEVLARLSSWHPEARLAVAQAATEARDFAKARETLAPLVADHPTVRTCLQMARIEQAEHGAETGRAREWLARATRAPRDPAWIADGIVSERWAPVSPISGRVDAFVWKTPPELLGGPDREAEHEPETTQASDVGKGPSTSGDHGPGTGPLKPMSDAAARSTSPVDSGTPPVPPVFKAGQPAGRNETPELRGLS